MIVITTAFPTPSLTATADDDDTVDDLRKLPT